ncbi:MetQ/NlpA family ABC transporter substrate-binding protein [Marisediminicola sp. LYQ85]|uniref:MetQ/NlpA family ABC transporter substrate-binding protein n=1 Tax=Marisediminicola sp. LYQ85 TaxID=3391062 RepID=UPI003983A833
MSETPGTPVTPGTPRTPDPSAPRLPERRKNRAPLIVGGALAAAAGLVAATLVVVNLSDASSSEAAADGAEPTVVRIGVSDESLPYWAILQEKAADENITIETVNFTDYLQPNPALADDQVDLNAFQHLRFLAQHRVDTGDDLVPIASTIIVPLGLYSERWESVDEIPEGGEIAIPNDPSNQARALFVLEAAGLVTLTGDEFAPTPADIDTEASRVSVITVDAAQTALSLPSVDGSIINNNFAKDADIDPNSAIFADDPSSAGAQPYINLIVARADEADDPVFERVAELYHDPEVLDSVVESSEGTAVVVEGFSVEDLRDLLAEIETEITAEG